MDFQAVPEPALRTALRPFLIIFAAFVLFVALLSPPLVDTAEAQGFSGFRGGSMPRFNAVTPRGATGGMLKKSPDWGAAGKNVITKGGISGITTAGTTTNPKGKRPPRRPGTVAGNPPSKGDGGRRPPRRPGGGGIVGLPPSGGDIPPGGPGVGSPNVGGSGQQPSTMQFSRRAGTGVPSADERRYVPNEVLVELAPNVSQQTLNAMMRRHRLTRLSSFNLQLTGTTFQRLRINDRRRSVPQVVRALEADGVAMAVQPVYLALLQEMPARGSFPADLEQYAIERMRMQQAHELATGSRVLVAVIDSGVDTRHAELSGMVAQTFDAIGQGDRVHAHGTAIVGAIAARARLRGIAPSAHILAARAFGTQRGSNLGTTDHILKSIDWAVARGARVINMSFAGARDPAIERHLAVARQRGIVLVAAAGNAGPNSAPQYPAALPGVIAVTATDEDNRLFRAATRGNHIVVAAPGVDLWLPTVDNGYRQSSGTSFAAALVSGAIALMLERNPDLTPDAVRQTLISTARGIGPRPLFGAGLIDAYQAVLAAEPSQPTAQAADPPQPAAQAIATEGSGANR